MLTLFFVLYISDKGRKKEKSILGGISWKVITLMRKSGLLVEE